MTKFQLVDLFSGVGSASLGFRKAGFEVAAALDDDEAACKIFEKNFGVKPINDDIRQVSGKEILKSAGLTRGDVDLVVGCPPCQGFSSLGRTRREKGSRDYRNSLVRIFVDRVAEIMPRAVVFENVPGMRSGPYRRYLRSLKARLASLGYKLELDVLQAEKYGVPQYRRRVIGVGVREKFGGDLLPRPTHRVPRTVRDAIADLPPLSPGAKTHPDVPLHVAPNHTRKTIELIRHVPRDGGSRRDLPRRFWLPCHRRLGEGAESVYGRMRWDRPSPTITTRCECPSTGRFIHPEQDRGITLREAARLQTIPDTFHLEGSRRNIAVWIGNAMPTRLGYVLGSHVTRLLKKSN